MLKSFIWELYIIQNKIKIIKHLLFQDKAKGLKAYREDENKAQEALWRQRSE